MSEIQKSSEINHEEIKFVVIASILILLLSSIPYLYGYFVTPSNKEFTAITSQYNKPDRNNYLAYMKQAERGEILFDKMGTSETCAKLFFQPFLLFLGSLSHIFGISLVLSFHTGRLIFGFTLLVLVYYFITLFLDDKKLRKVAFFFVALSSGFGAFLLPFGVYDSVDTWMSESITFWSIYENPLFVFSLSLMLLIFIFIIKSVRENNLKYAIYAGLATLLLGLSHQYDIATIYSISFSYLILAPIILKRKFPVRKFLIFFLVFIISVASIVYTLFLYDNDPCRAIGVSNKPPPWQIYLITGYGLIFILALFGSYKILKDKDRSKIFLLVWLVVTLLLFYSPLLFNRKLLMGFHIPLSIIASIGFFEAYKRLRGKINFNVLLTLVLTLSFASNLGILFSDMRAFSSGQFPFYIEEDLSQAFRWLEENTQPSDVILSSRSMGDFIQSYSGNKAFLVQWSQTLRYPEKRELVSKFFNENTTDQDREAILKEYDIDYVFYSSFESSIGKFNPEGVSYLRRVFTSGDVNIYRVEDLES